MNNIKIKQNRIPVEIQQLKHSEEEHGIKCYNLPEFVDSFSHFEAVIPGPKESPYENGLFKISIHFGEQYPFRPPTFKFVTPVYHPNIDNSGKICLDLLRMPPTGSYNPAITLESMLLSIQLLLSNPNPDDPLQGDAADLYKSNKKLFYKKAKDHVRKFCSSGKTSDAVNNSEDNLKRTENNELLRDGADKKKLKLNLT